LLKKYQIRVFIKFYLQVIREYTSKVDKLEAANAEREKEGENTEHKPIIMQEPQLMLTAGPAYQYATPPYGAVPPGSYGAPPNMNMPYQPGYGM
jgi:clathrin heavy chain